MSKLFWINIIILFSIISLSGCELVGDIFKAGMWVGVIGVALVVGLVLFVLGKLRG